MLRNEALIRARKRMGWTQEQLAEKLNCRKSTVSNWENGHSNPSLPDAFRIADLLESDVNDLFSSLRVQETHTFRRDTCKAESA